MNIPEAAVHAAMDATEGNIPPIMLQRAISAAAPFLQGVKVKALEWKEYEDEQGTPDRWDAVTAMGDYYFIGLRSDGYTVSFDYSDIGTFNNLEAAKAAAQADYAARILSAIEPAPSPRAQELEEGDNICARLEGLASWLDGSQHSKWCGRKEVPIHGYSGEGKLVRAAIAAIRALSSQPVADGWLPIETAPKDGTDFIGWDGKWPFRCSAGKKYVLYPHQEGGPTYEDVWYGHYYDSLTIEHPTHWRPLPASPGASE